MNSGYTVIKRAHVCPRPTDLPFNSVIQCNECGVRWVRSWFGWVPVREEKRGESS